jgi:glutamate synthase (NADPH/NADH) small chain
MYGIPNMKLDKAIIQRRIDLIVAEGVKFITSTEVGKDYPVDKLLWEFDAVALCGGATKPRDLPIEGRELKGIHFAMEFLHGNTKKLLDETFGPPDEENTWSQSFDYISARDKDVIVIGGGDTGTDCVGTALRHGCKSLAQFEILDRPPDERQPDNPWPEWPQIFRVDYGQEEYAALFGRDPRHYAILTKKFVGDENGHVKELHTVQIEWLPGVNSNRPTFREIPGTEKVWPAQLVFLSMGFLGPEDILLNQLGLERDERSNVKAEHGKFMTSVEGVFTAGDMRRGQSLVVWAINEGRGAAREVDRYLMGATNLP